MSLFSISKRAEQEEKMDSGAGLLSVEQLRGYVDLGIHRETVEEAGEYNRLVKMLRQRYVQSSSVGIQKFDGSLDKLQAFQELLEVYRQHNFFRMKVVIEAGSAGELEKKIASLIPRNGFASGLFTLEYQDEDGYQFLYNRKPVVLEAIPSYARGCNVSHGPEIFRVIKVAYRLVKVTFPKEMRSFRVDS